MIRNLAQCPYCKSCEIALDESPEVVFNPGSEKQVPCAHLIWLNGRYNQLEPGELGTPRVIGSTEFHWEHPDLVGLGDYDLLTKYVRELVSTGKSWEFSPPQPFEVVHLSADEKATDPQGKQYTRWEVDGEVLFARDSAAFLAALLTSQAKLSEKWKLE